MFLKIYLKTLTIIMIRVVIDTNIALAGFLSYTSNERGIINHAMTKNINLIGSEGTFNEFKRKLEESERFAKVAKDFMFPKSKLLSSYKSLIRLVSIQDELETKSYCPDDPDDDVFIKTALSSDTNIIVSNDKHILKINGIEGLRIIKSNPFLEILRKNFK